MQAKTWLCLRAKLTGMNLLWIWMPALLLLVCFVIGAVIEPRRLSLGLILTAAIFIAAVTAFAVLTDSPPMREQFRGQFRIYMGLAALVIVLVLIVELGAFLILNAVTMVRKEGLGIQVLLSGGIGVVMELYFLAGIAAIISRNDSLTKWLMLIALPAAYLGFLLFSFVLYSMIYGWMTKHFGRPVDAVIILGSGLGPDNEVPPLLAGRLERGRQVYWKSVRAKRRPILVVSGGKGGDEKISEAEAMAAYLREAGFQDQNLVLESRSTDTEENLEFSADLVTAYRPLARIAVATSDFHAFRAAIIMRKADIPGYTVGCTTARYYWPSAMLREFLAVIFEHSRLNMVVVALLCLPMLVELAMVLV